MMKIRMSKLPGLILISLGLVFASLTVQAELHPKAEKRMDKVLKKHLESAMFSREQISYNPKEVSFKPGNTIFYKLILNKNLRGYVYVDEAMGRYHGFTYMFLVNKDFEIEFVYVLEYSEDYGSEITSKKWLEQFKGLNPQSEIKFKANIDAISGATISSKSITESITFGLQKLTELKENGSL